MGNGDLCVNGLFSCYYLSYIIVYFFRLPKKSQIRSSWLKTLGLPESVSKSNIFVCSQHFKKEDFIKIYSSEKSILRKGSVPSIFSHNEEIWKVDLFLVITQCNL